MSESHLREMSGELSQSTYVDRIYYSLIGIFSRGVIKLLELIYTLP